MRRSFGPRRSATVVLLIVNVAAFLLQNVLYNSLGEIKTNYYLALSIDGLRQGFVWQLLSFQFMHANLLHLVGNCLGIYWVGREVEEALGQKSFWALYFSSGMLGGLIQALTGVLLGGFFAAPVVGASAGAFGLISAFAVLFPDRVLLLFFILPIRAKYLLAIFAVIAGAGIAFPAKNPTGPRTADAAHLGGMLAGLLFVRFAAHWQFRWPQIQRGGNRPLRRLVRVSSNKPAGWARDVTEVEEEVTPDEFLAKEVDPILDKISAHGIQSLTDRERKILETARTKMRKR